MAIFGLLLMIGGMIVLFLPANDMNIININAQFVGLSFSICGSVIFVGGFLQTALLDISNKLPNKVAANSTQISQETTVGPKSINGYQLANDFARYNSIAVEDVIREIAEGKRAGKGIDGYWYVEVAQ